MIQTNRKATDDLLFFVSRIINKLHSQWLLRTYPFHSVGSEFWAHSSCELSRSAAPFIKIGDRVKMDRDVCLNIPFIPESGEPIILLEDGCQFGRRCLICAQNRIQIGKNTIFGPSALVMDHEHACDSLYVAINDQRTREGGKIRIEEGCWIGFGAAIVCSEGELVIGRNSVIGTNSVVTRSIPPYSIAAGNPARVAKCYDQKTKSWVLGTSQITTHG